MFGDLMDKLADIRLPEDAVLRTSWLYALTRKINTAPSLYLAAGAIHGCVLCEANRPLLYMEDVGRHNAIDKIAGYMHLNGIGPEGKIFYTTGRLTSEMVIKTVQMRIPILISRSGFTAWGVDLARQAGLTLVGRAKGRRFVALSGEGRIVFDGDPERVEEESARLRRKASVEEEPA
jgi:FdhD protein